VVGRKQINEAAGSYTTKVFYASSEEVYQGLYDVELPAQGKLLNDIGAGLVLEDFDAFENSGKPFLTTRQVVQ